MSFYSYKNANPCSCPGAISGSALDGLQEKVCVQVKRVYDSCLQQEQLDDKEVVITSYAMVAGNNCGCSCTCNCCGSAADTTETVPPTSAPVPPITFESCRSTTTEGTIRNLTVERLCDRPCFARVRCKIDVPIDILFVDSRCVEYIGKGVITVDNAPTTQQQRRTPNNTSRRSMNPCRYPQWASASATCVKSFPCLNTIYQNWLASLTGVYPPLSVGQAP